MSSYEGALGGLRPFTEAQWQELEHQALILKYLIAGMPVPPELIVPIRRSFEALAGRYNHPSLSYYSYYGKKPDPEPGRCRRTDGKKWRCSKDAYPGSKYCERHMHRGRNRSRKPVESQTVSQTQNTESNLTSLSPSSNNASGSGLRNLQNITMHSTADPITHSPCISVTGSTQLPLGTDTLSNRYFAGLRADVDEHSLFTEASDSARVLGVDLSADNSWQLTRLTSRSSTFPLSKLQDSSLLQNAYPQLQSLQNIGQVTLPSQSRQRQNGPRQGILGQTWRKVDQTGPHFPQPSSPFHFQCPHLTSPASLPGHLMKIEREGILNTSSPLNLRRTSVRYYLRF